MKVNLKKYRSCFFLTGLLAFLLHGAKLSSGIIGIDTEDIINLPDGLYSGWQQTGRQGLVFLKYLLGNWQYNPYFSGAMTLLLFAAAVTVFLILWDRTGGEREGLFAWGCGALLWISHPAMVEQFYFSLQSMEICIAIVLTGAALYLSFQWVAGRFGVYAVGAACLLLVTFSVYQTFVVVYIFGVVSLLLLQALREASVEADVKRKVFFRRIFLHCVLFLTAFLLNTLITRFYFGSSSYLKNQIFWGRASVKDCLHAIAGHGVRAFLGLDSVFYNAGLGVLALTDLGLLFWFLAGSGKWKKRNGGMVLFYYLALLTTPFLMSVLLGGTPAMRSQLVLPVVTGFLGYLGVKLSGLMKGRFRQKWQFQVIFGWVVAVSLISGMEQAKVTGQLYYTDWCRYGQDAALGRNIIERIEQVSQENLEGPVSVVVVGGREFSGNNACVAGEVIGRSFFNYDRDVDPVPYWSSRRAVGFLLTLGADYVQVPRDRMGDVAACSADMPVWPAEGSVQMRDGMAIVKLSSE